MSKPKRERSLAENEAKAVARMLRVSPQKLNLVAQLIRGRKASAALADLQFSRKRIAVDVKKCLESATRTLRTTMTSKSTTWSSPRPMSATASS
jgi:large subunit ribosomal protein L22